MKKRYSKLSKNMCDFEKEAKQLFPKIFVILVNLD